MNHESSPAAGSSSHLEHGYRHQQPDAASTEAELAERRKKNRQLFNRKRLELLDDLLRTLDILVYAELSVIYYMEYAFIAA